MMFPPAFQVAAPFGAHTGGGNPLLFAANADAEFDSWITVGVTDASETIYMSPGLDATFDTWNESNTFSTTNGAIFWMSPPAGPQGTGIVIAQITADAGAAGSATATLQGRSTNDEPDWSAEATWGW